MLSFFDSTHFLDFLGILHCVFSLDGAVSLVASLTVGDIALVVSVDTLVDPVVVVVHCSATEVHAEDVGADDCDGELVTVVLEDGATSEVGPGKRHLIINY